MTFTTKLQLVGISAAVLLAGWQFQRHLRYRRELASVEAQLKTTTQELDSRRLELAAAEQRNRELIEAERRAGNQTLIALMRERAAATAESDDASRSHSMGNALANVLDNPEQQTIDGEYIRNEMRANMGQFFKLINLSPERIEQYIDLQLEVERRKAGRMSALLRGKMAVADALRERDAEYLEEESRRREILGPENYAFLQSIADGMRADEAQRTIRVVQENIGSDALNAEQTNQLQKLIVAEFRALKMDDTDLFRSPEDWAQFFGQHQENVLRQAAVFLSPAQLEAIQKLAALDLAQKQEEMIRRRKALGIK